MSFVSALVLFLSQSTASVTSILYCRQPDFLNDFGHGGLLEATCGVGGAVSVKEGLIEKELRRSAS